MHSVLGILLGTICSGGASFCLGTWVFRRLNLRLERIEHLGLALVVGAACLSQIVFFLCSIGAARRNVFLAIALLSAIFAVSSGGIKTWSGAKRIPLRWRCLFGMLFVSFGIVYLVNAMAPEMSPDGSAYHLPIAMRYLEAHGFENETHNLYSCLSNGIGLLFLPALSLYCGLRARHANMIADRNVEEIVAKQIEKRNERGGFIGRKFVETAQHPIGSFGEKY
jgi:hypothetical protein